MTPERTASPMVVLQRRLGRLMLGAVQVSAVLLAGGLMMLLAGRTELASDWLLRTGLLILMLTPVLRIIEAVLDSIRTRDWLFIATTAAVLLVLTATLLLALNMARPPNR
ncbi:MAG TPA: DUF1634 domain-containing protein [Vicinamibacterales bacterium]|nr:DUF1634 domain-containing protein [Vicinamibacterales bacterium]